MKLSTRVLKEARSPVYTDDARTAFHERAEYRWIYVIECQGAVKIGLATSPEARISGMQTGNPFKINFIYARQLQHADLAEHAMHEYLEDCKLRGEWFLLSEEQLTDVINKIEGIDEQAISDKLKRYIKEIDR